MTDYHPLIARAVEGLDKSTAETRRRLYERARNALVSQLRSIEPALSETEITKERLALEDAILKVEAEAARKAHMELRERQPVPPARRGERPAAKLGAAAAGAEVSRRPVPPATSKERTLNARTPSLAGDSVKGLRDIASDVRNPGAAAAKAAQPVRDMRDSRGSASPSHAGPGGETIDSLPREFEPPFAAEELNWGYASPEQMSGRARSFQLEEEPSAPTHGRPPLATDEEEQNAERPNPSLSYRGIVTFLVVLIILAGAAATASWQWPHIAGLYQRFAQFRAKSPTQTAAAPATQPKFTGRVPQERNAQASGAAAAPSGQTVPAVAQHVVLYEEDPNDPQGKRYTGSVTWRTETVSPGPGLAPELAVRADVEIPEKRMTVTWTMRRNTDKALPASHTIEVVFNLPADFPGGGIDKVPGILMKESEQARGAPLAGLSVKVTNGFFLIGLSAVDSDMQHNIQLLKERPWFDIPIVYTAGGRAILAMEKGPPGDRAFADAFAAWEKK